MTDRILMCAPEHFEVAYIINPWMEGNVAHGDNPLATRQWAALAQLIGQHASVQRIPPVRGLPDMVFTANAGLVLERLFVPSRFRHRERQGEEAHFIRWFEAEGYDVRVLPPGLQFEGAGDALLDRRLPLLWMGFGHRSHEACAPLLSEWLGLAVQPLRLINERFYHLDTCFCPLEGGHLLYYPAAFDALSQAQIAARVPAECRIEVGEEDAAAFACNAVNIGRQLFMNHASPALANELASRGFAVRQTALGEFMKAGGSAKCLTLRLNEERRSPLRPAVAAAA